MQNKFVPYFVYLQAELKNLQMKTRITILSTLALLCIFATPLSAQINFNALKNKAANAAKNAARNAANKAVDNAVDAIEKGVTQEADNNNTQNVQTQNTQTQAAETGSTSFQATTENVNVSSNQQKDDVSEALAKYVSYQDRIQAAITNRNIDFLLSDTFQKEIPALVKVLDESSSVDAHNKIESWYAYKSNATITLASISNGAPAASQTIARIRYYIEHAETSTSEEAKAFWLDRAMANCKFWGGRDLMVKNTSEMRDFWKRVNTLYDSLDAKFKRKDAENRNDNKNPEQIVFLQTGLPDFDKQYAEAKATYDKEVADKAAAAAANKSASSNRTASSNVSRSTTSSSSSSSSSNAVKVKELRSTGSDSYDVIGTNNSKIGSIKRVTSSDSYYIYDKSLRVVGEIRKNQGSSGYTIYKNSSRKGETTNFTQAAKWVLE